MRYAILTSITISQLGFVSAYTIFVAENLQAFVMAVTNCAKALGIHYFILLQTVIFLPLALIRSLAKLSTTALIAAPNNFTQNMIETRLRPALNRALSAALDRDVQIAVTVDASAMTDSSPADDAPPVPERRPDDRQL